MSNYKYSAEIDQEIVDFLEDHKNNGTLYCDIDNLLKENYPNFHESLDFGTCAVIDEIYFGNCGGYWRKAYNDALTGDIITKYFPINCDETEFEERKIYIKFAGIYTCDFEFVYNNLTDPYNKRVSFDLF